MISTVLYTKSYHLPQQTKYALQNFFLFPLGPMNVMTVSSIIQGIQMY